MRFSSIGGFWLADVPRPASLVKRRNEIDTSRVRKSGSVSRDGTAFSYATLREFRAQRFAVYFWVASSNATASAPRSVKPSGFAITRAASSFKFKLRKCKYHNAPARTPSSSNTYAGRTALSEIVLLNASGRLSNFLGLFRWRRKPDLVCRPDPGWRKHQCPRSRDRSPFDIPLASAWQNHRDPACGRKPDRLATS